MKKHILKSSNRIYGYIIGLLGFSMGCQACGQHADMYGQPHADYKISGRVTDASNNPIKGIEITVKDVYYDEAKPQTDASGNYSIEFSEFPNQTIEILYKDIDGAENGGAFADQTEKIPFQSEDFTGGSGNWYDGKAEKVVNVVLEEKAE